MDFWNHHKNGRNRGEKDDCLGQVVQEMGDSSMGLKVG